SNWFGVGAPKATPAEIVKKLNKEINAGLADRKLNARLADLGGDVLALSPAHLGKFIAEETEKWETPAPSRQPLTRFCPRLPYSQAILAIRTSVVAVAGGHKSRDATSHVRRRCPALQS